MFFWDFSFRFQNHPPYNAVNVCVGGRVVGLARLRKSARIVNHPHTPSELIAAAGHCQPDQKKSRQKALTVSLIDNKHNS